jgi:pantothenate kinase type III
MASGLAERLANTLSDTPHIALTGGAAALLHDALPRVDTHDPHLVLRGAYQLLRYRAQHE